MKQKAKIDNWEIEYLNWSKSYVLRGKIFDHPKQNEFLQAKQRTSTLISIDFKNKTAETLNTIYELVSE